MLMIGTEAGPSNPEWRTPIWLSTGDACVAQGKACLGPTQRTNKKEM